MKRTCPQLSIDHKLNGIHTENRDISQVECFKYKKLGHYPDNCLKKNVDDGTKPNSMQNATANHVNVEEVFYKPDQ
jgi:hypothetical protein